MKSCCNHKKEDKKCVRKSDKKIFNLPRKFSKIQCQQKIKGFTMRSSCAPYKGCKKQTFLYNPNNKKKSFNVYINKNPTNTIPIKYKTVANVEATIKKLERLYKTGKYSHKRIWQVSMIMKVRLEAIKKKHKKALEINKRFSLAKRYMDFLSKRTKLEEKNRKNSKFKI